MSYPIWIDNVLCYQKLAEGVLSAMWKYHPDQSIGMEFIEQKSTYQVPEMGSSATSLYDSKYLLTIMIQKDFMMRTQSERENNNIRAKKINYTQLAHYMG